VMVYQLHHMHLTPCIRHQPMPLANKGICSSVVYPAATQHLCHLKRGEVRRVVVQGVTVKLAADSLAVWLTASLYAHCTLAGHSCRARYKNGQLGKARRIHGHAG